MLFYGFECLLQILNYIINMLRADGQTDRVGPDALLCQFLLVELGMGGGCRMNHQTLHIRHVGQQREQFQVVYEVLGLAGIPLDLKGKYGTAPIGKILPIQRLLLWIIGHGRMMYSVRAAALELFRESSREMAEKYR